MTQPLVSIAVPVYNGARFLRESVDSILAQTYAPIEVIVLDDASTDETPAIAASYGNRIRYVRHAKNLGGFGNMNSGVALARGDLIGIYHADDVYEPTIVAREVEFLEANPAAGAAFCLDIFIDAEGREYGRLALPPEIADKRILGYEDVLNTLLRRKNRFLRAPGAMIRRSVYEKVGAFDVAFGIASDLNLWLRIARAYPIGMLHEYLYRYRHFHGNWSQQYQYLRTKPDTFFTVMDAWLASGEERHADPSALAAYEGQRAEEHLMNAVAHYIRGDLPAVRRVTAGVGAKTILAAPVLQRGRLLALLALLRVIARVPRIEALSSAFHRRWYSGRSPVRA